METHQITAESLKQFSILNELEPKELETLTPVLRTRSLTKGEVLFQEGEASDEIYLICSGRVEICKSAASGQDSFVIAENKEGEVFGELAFLDGSPRSAQVRAAASTKLLIIGREPLFQLPFSHKVIASIARISSEKLRNSASNYVGSLEQQIKAVQTQNEFGQFFIYILSLMAIGMIINNLMHTYLADISPYSLGFFIFYSLILLVPSLAIVVKLKMPMSAMGLTLHNWKRSLAEGIGICIGVILLFTAGVAVVRHLGLMPLKPFSLSVALTPWYMPPVYFVHSAAQELFSRGFLQTSFEHFFNDRTGVKSIGFAALLFGLFHIHFGIGAVCITFLSSLAFGAIYRRHRNLIGVSLVHYIAGVWAFVCGLL